jgi:transmembrane sensor
MENLKPLFEISTIIAKQKLGELTEGENQILQKWLDESENNKNLYAQLKNEKALPDEINRLDNFNSKSAYKKIVNRIEASQKTRLLSFIPKVYKVAASIALLVAASYSGYYYFSKTTSRQNSFAYIHPGTQKAILTTADNQKYELGKKKSIFNFIKALVVDTNSTLIYQAPKENKIEEYVAEYNQLETPRGGEYKLVLSDGTTVFLNSETKLRFPVVFSEKAREVELEGEAYFEVTKSEKVPFIIRVNNMQITVYGTSFNISAYNDDNSIQTTLVTGIVGIKSSDNPGKVEQRLVPGQQANYNRLNSEINTRRVNTDIYTAWTKGMFVFDNEPLEKIMQKLARWYNFEVAYSDDKLRNEPFTGDLKRFDNVTKILDMISIASDIEFKIEDKKVTVCSKK